MQQNYQLPANVNGHIERNKYHLTSIVINKKRARFIALTQQNNNSPTTLSVLFTLYLVPKLAINHWVICRNTSLLDLCVPFICDIFGMLGVQVIHLIILSATRHLLKHDHTISLSYTVIHRLSATIINLSQLNSRLLILSYHTHACCHKNDSSLTLHISYLFNMHT